MSKLLAKIALAQFDEHTQNHDLMPKYQSAYRANFSCETALVNLIDDLLWSMKNKKCTALMALDLSAAFDTVDYTVLLSDLEHQFGIQADVLSYCKVRVRVGFELRFSVSQGSCAGSTLYSAYASTFPQVKDESFGIIWNHVVKKDCEMGPEESDTIMLIEQNAKLINMWMDKNRLKNRVYNLRVLSTS